MHENSTLNFEILSSKKLPLHLDETQSQDPGWLTPIPALFQVTDIHFFACQYDVERIDFTHPSLSQIVIPDSLSKAIHKRKAEYAVGRYCALNALKEIGNEQIVERNPDRSPKWPPSMLGSITHTKAFSMAAVGFKENWSGIGIDTEFISPATQIESFSKQFISPAEFDLRIHTGLTKEEYFYAVFSAKESIFKCLYPSVMNFFGFFDVQIVAIHTIDSSQGSFTFELTKSLYPFEEKFSLNCYYLITPHYVHTLVAF